MRCTQEFGLTEEASRFLMENAVLTPLNTCPCCNHSWGEYLKGEVYEDASHLGMFDDGPQLMQYKLKDGRIAKEIEQATVWSSGPCIFLQLEIDGVKMFPHPQSSIDGA